MRNPDASAIHVGIKKWLITFTFHFHALEKEMAAHSSVLPISWLPAGTIKQVPTASPITDFCHRDSFLT